MRKYAALAVLAALAMTGCAAAEASERDQRCAELEAVTIEGDGQAMDAARESIERTIERLCR